MKYYVEDSLRNFQFWSGARDTVEDLTDADIDTVEGLMDDGCSEWSDTAINDFFWFERDTIAEWLGYDSYEDMLRKRNGGDDEEEEDDEEEDEEEDDDE